MIIGAEFQTVTAEVSGRGTTGRLSATLLPILLVEPGQHDLDRSMAALVEHRLQDELIVARNGESALELLCQNEAPALVIIELELPGLHGLEVIRVLKSDARFKSTAIVVLTQLAEDSLRASANHLGVNAFFRKPDDPSEFARIVSQAAKFWATITD